MAEKHIAATRFGQMLLKRYVLQCRLAPAYDTAQLLAVFSHRLSMHAHWSGVRWRTSSTAAVPGALAHRVLLRCIMSMQSCLGRSLTRLLRLGAWRAAGAEPGSAGEGMQAGGVPRQKRRKQAAEQVASAAGADEEQPPKANIKKKRKDAASKASAEVAVLAQQPTPQASAVKKGQRPDVLGLLLTGTGDLEDVGALTKKKRKRGTHA